MKLKVAKKPEMRNEELLPSDKGKILKQMSKLLLHFEMIEGTIYTISSDSPLIEKYVGFTIVPLK